MDIAELYEWLSKVDKHLNKRQLAIAAEILKELKSRIRFSAGCRTGLPVAEPECRQSCQAVKASA